MNPTMNTGAASLLPCPFCGSDPNTHKFVGELTAVCSTRGCPASHSWVDVAKWNRRVSTPQADAAIAAGGAQEPVPSTSEYGSWINKAKQATDCKLSFHRDEFKYLCQFEQELRKAFAPAASNGEQA